MAASHFDSLAQTLAATGNRRRLLRWITTLPQLAPRFALFALFAPRFDDESEAARRRRREPRRRRGERHQQTQDERKRKRKTKKKRPPPAQSGPPSPPRPCAQRCLGCCDGELCLAGTSAATCGRDGVPCTACANPTPACPEQVCAACSDASQCPADMLCHEGTCQACEVCARGCYYANVRQAVTDQAGPATVRVCPGTYVDQLTIERNVHLIGAGNGGGAKDTILAGTGSGGAVTIVPGLTVTLQRLRITGGARDADGAGLHATGSQVTLTDCLVTGNSGSFGGGIYNRGWLTLDHSEVTLNDAHYGGGVYNHANCTVVLRNGSSIGHNRATYPHGNSGGGIFNNGTVDAAGGTISGNFPDDCIDFVFGAGCPP